MAKRPRKMPTKAEAEKMMFGLYDIDHLAWTAQDLHVHTDFEHKERDATLVLEKTFPTLLMQRLGAYLEECINTLWDIRFPETGQSRIPMEVKLKTLRHLHEINYEAINSVWKARNNIAHNPKHHITWREFDKHINNVGLFVSQFAELEQQRRKELRRIGKRS